MSVLMPSFIFYNSRKTDDKEVSKEVQSDFNDKYTEEVLWKTGLKTREQWSVNCKKHVITGSGKNIPVKVGEHFYNDVIKTTQGKSCTYRLPLSQFSDLKNRRTKTYRMSNDVSVSISNEWASFSFPVGVAHSIENDELFPTPLSFSLQLNGYFELIITRNTKT